MLGVRHMIHSPIPSYICCVARGFQVSFFPVLWCIIFTSVHYESMHFIVLLKVETLRKLTYMVPRACKVWLYLSHAECIHNMPPLEQVFLYLGCTQINDCHRELWTRDWDNNKQWHFLLQQGLRRFRGLTRSSCLILLSPPCLTWHLSHM